jgi:hypothetical protein
MNAILWFLQGLLAFTFLFAGALKALRPKEKLTSIPSLRWATRLSALQIKLIGVAEIAGALALVEPWATGLLPELTPIAAACFTVLMLGSAAVRMRRKDPPLPFVPVALGVMAALVAVMRFRTLARGEGA